MSGQDERQPERICVACRQPAPKDDLERFVYHDQAGVVFDLRQKAPGRGAYVHADPECVRRAATKGGFSRSFKTKVVADPDELLEDLRIGIRRRLDEALRVALQSQNLFVGATAVDDAFRHDRATLLLVARDAGQSTRRKYVSNAERKEIPVRQALTGQELGALCGRDFVAVLAVAPSRPRRRIIRDIEKLAQLDAL